MPTPDALTAAIDAATADLDIESLEAPAEEIADAAPEDSDVETDEVDTDAEQPAEELEDAAPDENDADSDDPEDDAEDDEDDEPEDDEEEDGGDATLDLDADTVIVLPSGQEITGEELEKSILRQADYTRKTQELAEQRKELEETYDKLVTWVEERADNPSKWIAEIAEGADDPSAALAAAVEESSNPTTALAGVIRALVQGGKLAPEFVEKLGLQHIAEEAKGLAEQREIERLRKRLDEREQRETQTAEQQRIIAEYNAQWDTIVDTAGLEFESPQEAANAKLELMKFARDQQITNLVTAWKALAYERQQEAPKEDEPPKPAKTRAKETVARKRKAGAISRQSASGAKPAAAGKGKSVIDAAADAAWEKLGLSG